MKYNWQQEWWPNFIYDIKHLDKKLDTFLQNEGNIHGLQEGLKTSAEEEFLIDNLIQEALHTFSIEGEFLSRIDLRSSIRNQLGLNEKHKVVKDARTKGIIALMLKNRNTFQEELKQQTLFSWHKIMMEPYSNINKGVWRSSKEEMKIVSGNYIKEEVHFVAPSSNKIAAEMKNFISWANQNIFCKKPNPRQALVLAGIAHIYFESIHPFEDGNGRIGRAISEKVIAYNIGYPILYSISKSIHNTLDQYYEGLKTNQRRQDITSWLEYFIDCCHQAQNMMKQNFLHSIEKNKYFDKHKDKINTRQEKVLNKMWEAGPEGFTGGMRAKKYQSIAKTSKATATRDLQELVVIGALISKGAGRSRHYILQKNVK